MKVLDIIKKKLYIDCCFKIQLLQFSDKKDIFDISKGKSVIRINANNPYIKLNPVMIEADPFLFVKDNKLFLFYESKLMKDPGVIKMIYTTDLIHWSKPTVALKESCHLSFPWVFEYKDKVYMIPEAGTTNSIRLYEACDDSLRHFKFVHTMLHAPEDVKITVGYADSCLHQRNGKFFLFTQLVYEDKINTLELYMADSLLGEYIQHPLSPIQHNQKLGRNAGALMEYDGKLLRFSQDCTKYYGENVHINEITKLSPTEYEEHIVLENIIPRHIPFYKDGGHQFNAVEFKGKWIVATDAQEHHRLLGQRIVNKILKSIMKKRIKH